MTKPISETIEPIEVAIIGAGPAGLMAAEVLCAAGYKPVLFDAMPTPARKFLMAGKSGLNLTHSEPMPAFSERYGERSSEITAALKHFSPKDVRTWADKLGAHTFVGSSGRVFPKSFKGSPLLRAWLKRISAGGGTLRPRHKWVGWNADGRHKFVTPHGEALISATATVFALGGTSWPKLGSDGCWQPHFRDQGIEIIPFRPANCGFECDWSTHFKGRFAGEPMKGAVLSFGQQRLKGDFVISEYGVEGSAIYSLSAPLRDAIEASGKAVLRLDLSPDRSEKQLMKSLSKPRGKRSVATHLKRTVNISGAKAGLLRELLTPSDFADPARLASAIKSLPLTLSRTRPITEAISTAGGIAFHSLNRDLMVKTLPGTFVAGEMLDWEAPTGGYLLTACFAQGKQAATGAIRFLKDQPK